MVKFKADSIRIVTYKTKPDEFTVEFTTGVYQIDNLADLFRLQKKGVYKITVEEDVENA